jgi:hypothetical protein
LSPPPPLLYYPNTETEQKPVPKKLSKSQYLKMTENQYESGYDAKLEEPYQKEELPATISNGYAEAFETQTNNYNNNALSEPAQQTKEKKVSQDADRDWNAEYQKLNDLPDSKHKFKQLRDLAQDFVYCAQTFAVIIIR